MFAIIVPACLLPIIIVLFLSQHKAKKLALVSETITIRRGFVAATRQIFSEMDFIVSTLLYRPSRPNLILFLSFCKGSRSRCRRPRPYPSAPWSRSQGPSPVEDAFDVRSSLASLCLFSPSSLSPVRVNWSDHLH